MIYLILKPMSGSKIFNKLMPLSLRGGALASKFLLIIFISHQYELNELGEYALVVAGVSYFGYILGFDFYTYSSRQIVGALRGKQAEYIKNQFSFYFAHYLLTITVLFFVVCVYPSVANIAIIFAVLMILDHCAQEIMRLLVIFEHPLSANIQFFIRNGLWVYAYIIFVLSLGNVPFDYLWYFWICGEIISLLFLFIILKDVSLVGILSSKINTKWIFSGLKISFPLLLSTLSLRGIFTADRYILGLFEGKEIVGVYSYFSSFSSSIIAFVDASVVMIYYPKLIRYAKEGLVEQFNLTKRNFLRSLLITGSLIVVALAIVVPVLSSLTGKKEFLDEIGILYIMMTGSFLYCLSLNDHFDLYARNMDKHIIKSSVVSFFVSLISMVILGYCFSSVGIAIAQVIGIMTMLVMKYRYSRVN